MAGKPFKRGKRWVVMVELPRDPETGKRRQRTIYGATKREVQDAQVKLLRELATGTHFDPTTATVGDFLDHWLETVVRPNTSLHHASGTASRIRVWLRPHLGAIPLADLDARRIAALQARILAAGRAPKTAALVRMTLRTALNQAVRWRMLPRNVADDVDPPRAARVPAALWDGPDLARFLRAVPGFLHEALCLTLLGTGLRLGEALGLTWGDVDLERGHLAVRRNLIDLPGVPLHTDATKGRRGRAVQLSPDTVATLRAHRAALPAPPAADRPVFADKHGAWRHHAKVRRSWTAALRRWGLPHIRLHDLRHLHATYLLLQNVHPAIVADRLGHASTAMTTEIYSHVVASMQRDAATRFDAALASYLLLGAPAEGPAEG